MRNPFRIVLIISILLLASSCAHQPIPVIPQSGAGKVPVIAETTHGKIQGFEDGQGLKTFLGIPYAKQPVGKLRFTPPQEPDKWDGIKQTVEFSPSCPQIKDKFESASLWKQGEDCLSLNIWTPGLDSKKRPVIIYIHGGGFMNGGTSDPHYNGRFIAKRGDIVFASINYRINAFGFLFLEDFGKEFAGTGNNAIRDQLMAIRWIKKNAANFGGDPDNITVMGESAGSASVLILMGLPQAKGLFHKAIAESGGLNLIRTREQAKAHTAGFMELAGVKDVTGLRSLSVEQIVQAIEDHLDSAGLEADLLYAPVIDGVVIPGDPLAAISNGAASGIALLTGTTLDEYRYWINYSGFLRYLPLRLVPYFSHQTRKKFHGHEDEIFDFYEKKYPDASCADHTFSFVTDMMFLIPHIQVAEEQSKYAKVFMYRFDWKSRAKDYLGACHVIELLFALRTFDSPKSYYIVGPEPPMALSDAVQGAWVAFARSGNPNTVGLPAWPSYDDKSRATMIMNIQSRVADDLEKDVRLFYKGILY